MNFLMPLLFYSILLTSTIVSFSTESWFQMWLGLEVNMMMFIPLMMNKNNSSSKSMMMYFIVQSFASSLLLLSLMMKMLDASLIVNSMLTMSLLTKLGMFPMFFWFPEVMEGLAWTPLLVLSTWQKLIPLYILSNINSSLIIVSIFFSSIIGAAGMFNLMSIRKILSFSSINNMAWMVLGMLSNSLSWTLFLFIYSLMMLSGFFVLSQMNISSVSQLFLNYNSINLINMSVFLLSLGGMPPLLGFIPKWLMIMSTSQETFFMVFILVLTSLLSMFIYVRMMYSYLIFSPLIKNINIKYSQMVITPLLGLSFLAVIPQMNF